MAIKFRTTDALQWGTGLGRNLTATEVDQDIWDLLSRIVTLEGLDLGVGFDTGTVGPVSISGNLLTFYFTDNSTETVTLPVPRPNKVEDWAPLTSYLPFDFVKDTSSNRVYIVLFAHTSAATFDPGANDGIGDDYYGLWFDPSQALSGLTDVDLSTEPAAGVFLRYTGTGGFWYDGTADFTDLTGNIDPEQYPEGLEPFAQTITQATDGSLAIDIGNGRYCHASISQDITAITITGWPVGNTAHEVGCEVYLHISKASGGWQCTGLPTGTLSPGGTIPTLTSNTAGDGIDRWCFSSDDEGASIYLDVLGNDYIAV